MEKYDHKKIETKWQEYWAKHPELFAADDNSEKEKKYVLDMFPYPSGAGLHVGHVESYTATDIISRYYRMNGKNVLHPQGWDAFGLPAENYAIKTGVHPNITTHENIKNFTRQIKSLGMSYDWSREIDTSSPEYYKWTQWFFLLLYKNGLAYKKKANVNWCESCQTVLANEQAEGGICDRCQNPVVQKDLEQWFFKITDFIENKGNTKGLIKGLEKIDWPESTKAAQKNWIGKSEGVEFEMKIKGVDEKINVFTTRIDTVFGMTYAVVAPEHEIIEKLKDKIENYINVEKYLIQAKNKTNLERTDLQKEKTGIEIKGIKIINPFNNEEIPLYVADYVLGSYGTGAVMAVPAHDERDFEFAKKNNLPIIEVIKSNDGKSSIGEKAYTEDGILVSSKEYDGLTSEEAREKMSAWLSEKGIGGKKTNYRLRDWLVSRQRYWGAPIPIIYCDKCGEVPVPEKDLPVMLPDDVDFVPTGESPLAKSKKFHDVKCPICGGQARRESDTMDTFVCSSWYYLRYSDPKNDKEFASPEMLKYWLPVDLYVGGAEHSVLHLLYARFFTKVLHSLGFIDFDEPFLKLRHQGIILAEDGNKMSKSLGNVINPDEIVEQYGADALRMFEMFMGPLEAMKPWNTKGINGISRFLDRTFSYLDLLKESYGVEWYEEWLSGKYESPTEDRVLLNKAIKKVSEDIENFRFNTAVSQLMILRNLFDSYDGKKGEFGFVKKDYFEKFIKLLSPFAPHMAEEIWEKMGYRESIFKEKWPVAEEKYLVDEEVEMVVQINGKVRGKFNVASNISEEEAKKLALSDVNIQKWLENKEPKKIIFIKGRLLNVVV